MSSRSRLRLVLGQLPGLGLLDVAVQPPHPGPDRLQRLGQLEPVEQLADDAVDALERVVAGAQGRVLAALGDHPLAVALDHRQRPRGQVAPVVGELALVAGLEACGGDAAVLAEGDLAHAVEAQRVGAEALDHLVRVEHVAERLRHLLLAHQQVAVDVDVPRRLDPRREQERLPVDGVELEDVLADHVQVGGPEALGQVLALAGVGERRVVVEERVPPDVDHLSRVPRHRNAPGDASAARARRPGARP